MTISYDDPRVLKIRQEEQEAMKKVRRYESALLAILAKRAPEEGPPGLTDALALRYVETVEAFEKQMLGDLYQRFEALMTEAGPALNVEAMLANARGTPVAA